MKDNRGAALLIVLWFLVLISALAVAVSGTVRTEIHLVRNLVEEARARHIAQAGVYHAVLTLLDPKAAAHLIADGSVIGELELYGAKLRLRIRDECGKVDINTGWGSLVTGLLTAHGEERAFELSQAILDWRDPDHQRRIKGAEDDDYVAAGLPYGARDGLFETIEELQQVRGMTVPLFERLARDVTVDCLNAGIDPLAASPAVLASIPDIDPATIGQFLRARREAAAGGEQAPIPRLQFRGKYVVTSPDQVYSIESTAELPSGARVAWNAIVWLTGDATRPFLFRSWRRAVAEDFAPGRGTPSSAPRERD